jgi:putative transposase
MEKDFCIEALEEALSKGLPEIFNSDQGSQFTSMEFTKTLEGKEVKISMDGKGRCLDNIFVERLWRSVKYEETYLKNYATPLEALKGLKAYFNFYNNTRPHQSLNYKTPAQIYFQNLS